MPHKINSVLMEPGTQHIGQFNRVCDKLFCSECATDVFAIRLSGSTAIPLDYDEFLFEFMLKGVSKIHGGHSGTTVQEKQNWERRVVPANENELIHVTDAADVPGVEVRAIPLLMTDDDASAAMVRAALELARAGYELLLVGGQVRNYSLALIGAAAVRTLESYHADRAFLGSSGTTIAHGHSTPNPLDAEVKRAMIRCADEAYVLTDASKFGHACLANYARLDEIAMIITDPGIPTHFLAALTERGIGCRLADTDSGSSAQASLAAAV